MSSKKRLIANQKSRMKKKYFFLIIVALTFIACSIFEKSNKETNKELKPIGGFWEEHWDYELVSPHFPVHRVYFILQQGDSVQMSCPGKPNFEFSDIFFVDDNLLFTITITDNLNDVVVWKYDLILDDAGILFTGTVKTNKGKGAKIELKRIN